MRSNKKLKMDRIIAALEVNQLSKRELADIACTDLRNLCRLVDELHSAKQVHIAKYERNDKGGIPIAFYALGEGKDAKPLPPLDKKAINLKYCRNLRKDTVRHCAHLAKQKHYRDMKKFVPRPDMAAAWIKGVAA